MACEKANEKNASRCGFECASLSPVPPLPLPNPSSALTSTAVGEQRPSVTTDEAAGAATPSSHASISQRSRKSAGSGKARCMASRRDR